eukprot:Tbor_TRINITY_DN5958_c0_g5::TRINITY_DN5958_c0_g5_i1::g.19164::m.19164
MSQAQRDNDIFIDPLIIRRNSHKRRHWAIQYELEKLANPYTFVITREKSNDMGSLYRSYKEQDIDDLLSQTFLSANLKEIMDTIDAARLTRSGIIGVEKCKRAHAIMKGASRCFLSDAKKMPVLEIDESNPHWTNVDEFHVKVNEYIENGNKDEVKIKSLRVYIEKLLGQLCKQPKTLYRKVRDQSLSLIAPVTTESLIESMSDDIPIIHMVDIRPIYDVLSDVLKFAEGKEIPKGNLALLHRIAKASGKTMSNTKPVKKKKMMKDKKRSRDDDPVNVHVDDFVFI